MFKSKQEFLDEVQRIEDGMKKLELECDSIIWELVNRSDMKLDKYKLPNSIKGIDLDEDDWEEIKDKVTSNMEENDEEVVDDTIVELFVDTMAVVLPLVQESYGDKFQGLLKERVIEKVASITYKQVSAKAGNLTKH